MQPWIHLDKTNIPGGGELKLSQRGDEFSIRLAGNELMNSRLSGSEEALATLSCARIADRKRPRILIGGLGMGFTLRAALAVLGPEAKVVVAELLPAVIAWARGPMAALFGDCLDDPRVTIEQIDVARLINPGAGGWDAILLDVDNGPIAMVQDGNERLYQGQGLVAIMRALKPRGRVTFWSASQDTAFAKRLTKGHFKAEVVPCKAYPQAKRKTHTIFVGDRPG
jgi:spermidine synthase